MSTEDIGQDMIDDCIQLSINRAMKYMQEDLNKQLGKNEKGENYPFAIKFDIQIHGPREKQKELMEYGAKIQKIMDGIPKEFDQTMVKANTP